MLEKAVCKLIEYYNYHRNPRYKLVKYLLRDGKEHPVALILPGGGYHRIDSYAEGYPYAKKLNAMGCHAFVLYYRYDENGSYPAPLEDVAKALRTLQANAEAWKLDLAGYSLWGGSAGGHLAALFAAVCGRYGLPDPGAVILAYPVITMGEGTHEGSRDHLLGKHPDPNLPAQLSVEKLVTEAYPPTFLWWGEDDSIVDPVNSRLMHDALETCKVPHRAVPYPGVDHGVGIGEGLPCEGWFEEAVRFWSHHRNKKN